MYYVHCVLVAIFCLSLTLTDRDCGPGRGQYYDPITDFCHPCSDCSDGRTSNVYCENQCKGGSDLYYLYCYSLDKLDCVDFRMSVLYLFIVY